MYNLFRILVRYQVLILFLILEVTCFVFIYRSNRYQRATMLQLANGMAGTYYQAVYSFQEYLYLKRYNDSLVRENARLRGALVQSAYDMQDYPFTQSDTLDKKLVQVYSYLPAEVIKNSVNQANNILLLNRGKASGIQPQMGVICPNGVVGQVVSVTEHYSAVMSLLSKNFKLSAKLSRSDYFGNLAWTGKSSGSALLTEIPKHVVVKPGDTVVTSGYSLMFPRDLPVGIVKSVKVYPDQDFMDISVTLTTDFGNLSYVYVIKDLRKEELVQLDSLKTY